ncbi:MAG: hypothetical protein QXP38_13465 [Nitrososphaerota archaeon]
MKRLNFDWGEASKHGFDKDKYEKALQDLKKYEDLLKSHIGIITGYWIGMKNGEPYIMVAVEKGKCEEPEKLIPDKLGGIRCLLHRRENPFIDRFKMIKRLLRQR